MIRLILIVATCGFLASCSQKEPKSESDFIEYLTTTEDSIKVIGDTATSNVLINQISTRFVNKSRLMFKNFPKAKRTPEFLDKSHMLLSVSGKMKESMNLADTIIRFFPNYVNRPMILESQAVAYDMSVYPRDSIMVRKYYTMLLNENPDLDKEKRKDIENRLKQNDVSLDTYIQRLTQE